MIPLLIHQRKQWPCCTPGKIVAWLTHRHSQPSSTCCFPPQKLENRNTHSPSFSCSYGESWAQIQLIKLGRWGFLESPSFPGKSQSPKTKKAFTFGSLFLAWDTNGHIKIRARMLSLQLFYIKTNIWMMVAQKKGEPGSSGKSLGHNTKPRNTNLQPDY